MRPDLKAVLGPIGTLPPAPETAVREALMRIGATLPDEYRDFLLMFDGAEGWVGDEYVALYSAEHAQVATAVAAEFVDGLVLIGSDGGGEAYALDTREPHGTPVVRIPFVPLDPDEIETVSADFGEWLLAMGASGAPTP